MEDVIEVIAYEYIEAAVPETLNLVKYERDVSEHLSDIHSFGFIFADLKYDNIIFGTELGKYQLIDYGNVFHPTDPRFPPLEALREGWDFSQEEDWERLGYTIEGLRSGKFRY